LSSALAILISKKLPSEAIAVQKPSYVTYTFTGSQKGQLSTVTLLESRSLLFASGTTGLRTWEAALHLASYLVAEGRSHIQGKRVLELGAGTGLLSILCARWLGAEHVIATDGDDGVVEALGTNFFLNGIQDSDSIIARSLWWGQALDEGEGGEQERTDLVLGADITYDVSSLPPLISTLRELLGSNRGLEVLVGVAIRNPETYAAFLKACEQNMFDVLEIDFPSPPMEFQMGPFYSTITPFRIVRITSSAIMKDPFGL
jgi:predicted nicotinamide N-methyase